MQEPTGAPETGTLAKDSERDNRVSASLNAEAHDDAEVTKPRDYLGYSEDEIDRQIRAICDWFSIQLKNSKLIDIVGIITGIAVVVVGIIAAFIYYGQLVQIKQATNEAHASVVNAEEAMRIDERAWVTISDIEPKSQDPLTIKIVLINTGRTPAKGFTLSAAGDIDGKKGIENRLRGRGVIAPGGTYISLMLANGSLSNSTDLTIHGRIDYESIFGGQHWTTFCYQIHGRSTAMNGFAPCDSGNETDNNSVQ